MLWCHGAHDTGLSNRKVKSAPKCTLDHNARPFQTDRRTDGRTNIEAIARRFVLRTHRAQTYARYHDPKESIKNNNFSFTNDMPFTNVIYSADISSLTNRRRQLSHRLFESILVPASCLHSLLPNQRDPSVICHRKTINKFPCLTNRTKNMTT